MAKNTTPNFDQMAPQKGGKTPDFARTLTKSQPTKGNGGSAPKTPRYDG